MCVCVCVQTQQADTEDSPQRVIIPVARQSNLQEPKLTRVQQIEADTYRAFGAALCWLSLSLVHGVCVYVCVCVSTGGASLEAAFVEKPYRGVPATALATNEPDTSDTTSAVTRQMPSEVASKNACEVWSYR